ncbi:hypothetical protein TSAR_001282 [Trichomalopsis sarcophagae]|uniref:Uncharacterized protein n=1 Tax=Trichomalopsis sarcophagae TaxID=543379 RepID=A0A232EH38_9HYME|nr:hypothetical protein TSAR_001282 [Trichomalopsis sarcophagae]
MYKLKFMRSSRKPLEKCTPDHRARMNRLFERARQECSNNHAEAISAERTSANASVFGTSDINQSVRSIADSIDEVSNDTSFLHGDMTQPEYDNSIEPDDHSITDSEHSSVATDFDNLEAFESRLARAFTECNMSHVQSKCIIDVLRTHDCFRNMHKDPRTILKTPAHATRTSNVGGGEYLHLGVEQGLLEILA